MGSMLCPARSRVLQNAARSIKSLLRPFSSFQPLRAEPVSIGASLTEKAQGRLDERNLEKAVRQVRHDGLVVVMNAVDTVNIDKLNKKMVEDALKLRARGKDSPFNYNPGNLQQDAPPVEEYFHPDIFFNPIATQITSAVLGPRPKLTFCSGNSAMPPTLGSEPQRQPEHSDADFAHPDHPFALVVNVPLVDMKPENGSTEVWLETHQDYGLEAQEGAHGERNSGRIRQSLLEERSKTSAPSQPFIPKGSIIVRDLKTVACGYAQLYGRFHFAPWYRNQMKVELAEELKPLVEDHPELDVRANYVSQQQALDSYLDRPFGNFYDFGQAP
ncbi:hypothetical protein ABEF95_004104 [Exophiala dermatitidis]|uniref:Phytanoyl-CoA dioxygenase n=2 Tax=Exophiala dermatitidis TaxID=5970 RepID=H6C7M3_EXODN|nr:uncharacterized protein HMPREF1120_06855 [Exophiala dermatitidis NIH/UT8656]KAJ4523342.1 hypothetical protein HRR75_001743 [Exophiala dermatitidis]EHY58853.1 hypothetical protein HMPREF1120_06855 [Exophiala dermatitidis NIH/UT8656]KAJ4532056.1 hypothetical protein HRR76_007059 [Exophiala dermatitidis]KAJ4546091.1 hypothetical protein HRR77_004632 [Exophiala dermatitidis]KAJ4560311.1 hypothetical protein HRR78_000838 [Exophiala dermatitidis]